MCERLKCVNAMYCRVSNEIDLFKTRRVLFWFIAFTITGGVALGLKILKDVIVVNFQLTSPQCMCKKVNKL